MKKDLIKELINNKIRDIPNYNDIKTKINVTQYISEKKETKKPFFYIFLSSSSITVLCVLLLLLALFPKTEYVANKQMIVNSKEFMALEYDYIFIGKVTNKDKTKKYNGTGTNLPFTFYNVEVLEYLKGSDEVNKRICFFGGRKNLFVNQKMLTNKEMPEINQVYLFFVNKNSKSSFDERINQNDFILTNDIQKIKLNEYQEQMELEDQTRLTQDIIYFYQEEIIIRKII